MGSSHTKRFWSETDRYHHIPEQIDRQMEITHPDYITTSRLLPVFMSWSRYPRTCVTYIKIRNNPF